ncbi:toxin-antitoxin system HicB family antitoxin [Enterobacter sp. ASE]|uniref:toxin-antitoxin system HicB family antitoxin n=1 Tax=Enterobacter sp. ASE TaxID=2905968 RepID=UPI001E5FC212|nr:toxin-antitoxin system HicB family antitoxin [Enterobacter sp. ASE]MCE3118603.1 toxin-antitoxin system HicB family antitoxin [Enterobacter sp. ASE]
MSTEKEIIVRDSQPRGAGKSPPFHMRISPELKAQFENEAQKDGVSLGNWLKELGRAELKQRGIEPKG